MMTCDACNGLGVALRENPHQGYRLFEWPCPWGCVSLIPAVIVMHKQPKVRKAKGAKT